MFIYDIHHPQLEWMSPEKTDHILTNKWLNKVGGKSFTFLISCGVN